MEIVIKVFLIVLIDEIVCLFYCLVMYEIILLFYIDYVCNR